MAKTSLVFIPTGLKQKYFSALASGNRFQFARMARSIKLISYKYKKALTKKSLLPIIADEWEKLTTSQKDAYSYIGSLTGMTRWRFFVADMVQRIKTGLEGISDLSELYQLKVGRVYIPASSGTVRISQTHPFTYFVIRKVPGTKGQYEPVKIQEPFSLPFSLSINYRAVLESDGPSPVARFYAEVYSLYQGRTIVNIVEIPFTLDQEWVTATSSLSVVKGQAIGYNLFIEFSDVSGELFFDHVEANHSAQNWARDPFCTNIRSQFTKAFFQIPRHWAPVLMPEGADYNSVYYDPELYP